MPRRSWFCGGKYTILLVRVPHFALLVPPPRNILDILLADVGILWTGKHDSQSQHLAEEEWRWISSDVKLVEKAAHNSPASVPKGSHNHPSKFGSSSGCNTQPSIVFVGAREANSCHHLHIHPPSVAMRPRHDALAISATSLDAYQHPNGYVFSVNRRPTISHKQIRPIPL